MTDSEAIQGRTMEGWTTVYFDRSLPPNWKPGSSYGFLLSEATPD